MTGNELIQAGNGRFSHFLLHHGRPAEECAGGAEGHARPAPEVEGVLVVDDEVVLDLELGVDDVVNLAVP